MKKILLLFSLTSLCFTAAPAFAADECCQSTAETVQQKLRDIDVTVGLKQYEQLKTELAKAQLQLAILEIDLELGEAESARVDAMRKRVDRLNTHASEIRQRILKLAEETKLAAK